MSEWLEKESELEREQALDGGSAAISLALDGAKGDPALRTHIGSFLEDQRGLIADQRHHLREQLKTSSLDHLSKRLRVAFQGLTILVGLLALASVGAIAWSAYNDRGLVIDGFSVPPDLAQQGATGAAVATELHDKLGQLHEETTTGLEAVAVRQKASSEARVEIPETGVSLGEVNRLLHEWLGHETHVSGELAHVAAGPETGTLTLNIRVGDRPGVRLTQADGDLEALLGKAAEQVYGSREPLLYADWLDQHGRTPEAVNLARRVANRGKLGDRIEALWKLAFYQQADLAPAQQRVLLARGVQLDPAAANWNNLAVADWELGRTELAVREMERSVANGAKALRAGLSAEARGSSRERSSSNLASYRGDYAGGLKVYCTDFHVTPCELGAVVEAALAPPESRIDTFSPQRPPAFTNALANVHDTQNAQRLLASPRADISGRSEGFQALTQNMWIYAAVQTHRQQGDWTAVSKDCDAQNALAARWPGLRSPARVSRWCPVALAHLGDAAGARAAADALPRDCYPCAITHGLVEAALGDGAASDRWFATAVRMGPSVPQAEQAWAEVLLAGADVTGALKQAQASYAKGPRFADALEVWGEALLMRSDAGGAAAKFAEAAKLAPRWGRLHLKWGEALARLGKADEARAQLKAAAGLDLTSTERAELTALKL
jgi:tetratricopeptide (TPR) repeat protein